MANLVSVELLVLTDSCILKSRVLSASTQKGSMTDSQSVGEVEAEVGIVNASPIKKKSYSS